MLSRFRKWNTLRSQILVIFLVVIVAVLLIVSYLTFSQVATMLKSNAEKQIQQTVVEANGRLESLYEQINTASKLVVTNDTIQRILMKDYEGKKVPYSERQQIKGITNTIQANSNGIFSFELYGKDFDRLLPLGEGSLSSKVERKWIRQADLAKGRLIWIGEDPHNSDNILVLRRVNLMNHGYKNGGYLLISIYQNYFQFNNNEDKHNAKQYSILLDKDSKPILTNYDGPTQPIVNHHKSVISLKNHDYLVSKQTSELTGWTVLILTQVEELTKGISVLKMDIIFSGIIGFIIFLVCSLFLSNMITKPIIKLTKTMRQASEGALTINPEVSAVNEINELNSTYNQLVKETNHLIHMVYQKELIRSQSELKALQAQINPHFLFNTLDALRWSLEDKDEEELAELVVSMSNLFRYTITKQKDGDWVTIREEIEHIENYMEIIKMRFGDHLKWYSKLEPQYEHVKIPKLLIQPLVENAVLHGAGNTVHPCTIIVTIEPSQNKDYLRILIQDDGPGMDQEKLDLIKNSIEKGEKLSTTGNGMAVSNVNKRLQLYYQDQIIKGITITSEVNKGTSVSFEIPLNGGE